MYKNSWVQLGKSEDGSTAIEFAFLSFPFILILVGIIELSMMFTSAALLEASTSTASRQIRIGAIQRLGGTPEDQEQMFRDFLCDQAGALIPCADISLEVLNVGSFQGAGGFAATYDGNGDLDSQGFDAGGVSDVILIRTFYRYSFMTPLIGNLLGEGVSGTRSFLSTIVLQNEPYEF